MAFDEFIINYASIIQTLFSGLGLLTVILLWFQIKQTNKWNRLKAEQTFYSYYSRELTTNLSKELEKLGIHMRLRITPLTTEEINTVFEDKEGNAYYALIDFLNDMEVTAMSILAGKVDEVVAYETHNVRLNQALKLYSNAIIKIKETYDGSNVFSDMYILQKRWAKNGECLKRKIERQENIKKCINNFLDRILRIPQGTRKRIK